MTDSTVSRELRRNRSVDGYQPAVAQKLSTSRRKAAGKRRMHEDTIFFVEAALNWLWSPEQSAPLAISSADQLVTNGFTST
ncbi:hypothetical protein EWM60_19200 [Candidatus Erwinia dacicola]|nr:hypothetical protein [Candidatus Erwinia dacicola]